jgi:hypothetical protein
MAFVVLGIILGMLAYYPEATLLARLTILGVGTAGVALQAAIGLWHHRALL